MLHIGIPEEVYLTPGHRDASLFPLIFTALSLPFQQLIDSSLTLDQPLVSRGTSRVILPPIPDVLAADGSRDGSSRIFCFDTSLWETSTAVLLIQGSCRVIE